MIPAPVTVRQARVTRLHTVTMWDSPPPHPWPVGCGQEARQPGWSRGARSGAMTGSDLIVLAPWILFGAGVSAVMFRLCRPGDSAKSGHERRR